jgi:hypothetical protein
VSGKNNKILPIPETMQGISTSAESKEERRKKKKKKKVGPLVDKKCIVALQEMHEIDDRLLKVQWKYNFICNCNHSYKKHHFDVNKYVVSIFVQFYTEIFGTTIFLC